MINKIVIKNSYTTTFFKAHLALKFFFDSKHITKNQNFSLKITTYLTT